MAILWEQRELVTKLESLQASEVAGLAQFLEKNATHSKELENLHLQNDGTYWIYENDLIDALLKGRGKDLMDRPEVMRFKRLITASIEAGFVDTRKNEGFDADADRYSAKTSSARMLSINDSKAPELQNNWYFWLKYLPEVFPQPASIIVSLLTSFLTSAGIWYYVVHYVLR